MSETQRRPADFVAHGALYHQLCSHRDQLLHVEGTYRDTKEHIKIGKKRTRHTGLQQRQWLVQWKDTIMEKWEITLSKKLGYEIVEDSQRPATLQEAEVDTNAVCEYCLQLDSDEHNLYTCPACARGYHSRCVNYGLPLDEAQNLEQDDWICPECQRYEQPHARKNVYRADIQAYHVKWKPRFEPEELILENPDGNHLLAQAKEQVKNRPQTTSTSALPVTDSHKSNLHRQTAPEYTPPQICRPHTTIGDASRRAIQVLLTPINPDADVAPTGRYTIQLRQTTQRLPAPGRKGLQNYTREMACLYEPEGHCIGMLDPARAAVLYDNFQQASSSAPLVAALNPGTFAEELALLLLRYKEGTPVAGTKRQVKLKNHWSTPPAIYSLFQNMLQATKERFASPLNYNTKMAEYWSCHERDQLFGAHHDAYSCHWTGYSVANPEYEPKDMDKAVAWAVHSARTATTPTLTVFILPAWTESSSTAYLRWARKFPSNCEVLLRIPKSSFRFLPPHAFGTTQHAHDTGNPKWDVNVLLVYNDAGYQHSLQHKIPQLQEELCSLVNKLFTLTGLAKLTREWLQHFAPSRAACPPVPTPSQEHLYRSPSKVLEAPSDLDYPQRMPLTARSEALLETRLRHAFPEVDPLLYEDITIAYTDGSRLRDDEGRIHTASSVYIPNKDETKDVKIGIHPRDTSRDNTIVRAELGGIRTAVILKAPTILTDSLTSLQLIWKQLTRPYAIGPLHRHSHLVTETVQEAILLAQELQQPIVLGKVKAHSGIPGNEVADEIAQATARGEQVACEDYPVPDSNRRTELYWPCTEKEEEDRDGEIRIRIIYADSLEGAVRTHSIDALRLGGAKTDTIYYKAMQNQMHRIDSQHLEFLASTTLLTTTEKIRRIQYLTGTLHSRKRAYWYGFSNTDICPNCKSNKDGGSHIMSACPAMTTSYLS